MQKEFGTYGRLINGDCLEVMQTIPDGSVDLICFDPPNLLADDTDIQSSEDNDIVLYATMDFDFLAKQIERITKKESAICVFGHSNFQAFIHVAFAKAGLKYVSDLIWVKPNSINFIHAKRKPLSQHELITVFKKEKLNFNWEEAKEYGFENYKRELKGLDKGTLYTKIERTSNEVNDGSRFMKTVIYAPSKQTMKVDERTDHPTQKPVLLLEKLVKAFSFQSQTVLDNTMGSGTTCVAAVNTKRKFIGIEKEQKYFDIACKRVDLAIIQDKQNLF